MEMLIIVIINTGGDMTDWEKKMINKYCEMKCHQSINMENICDYPEALVCHSDKIDLLKAEIKTAVMEAGVDKLDYYEILKERGLE